MPAGDKYHILLRRAGHMGWVDYCSNPRATRAFGRLATPENDDVVRISGALSVVFLDAFLKNSAPAQMLLNEKYAKSLTGRVIKKITWFEK